MYFRDLNLFYNYIYLQKLKKNEVWWISVASESRSFVPGLITALNNKNLDYYGIIIPGVIWEGEFLKEGFLAVRVPLASRPVLITDMESSDLKGIIDRVSGSKKHMITPSLMVFYDGYSFLLDSFIKLLSIAVDDRYLVFGAGAGVADQHIPSLFGNSGFYKNAAFLLFINQNISVGIRHGLQRIGMPLQATKVRQNVLSELNYHKAFTIYQDLLKKNLNISVPIYRFTEAAIDYPLGIFLDQYEDLIRDLLAVTQQEEIISMGEIPENCFVGLLKTDKWALQEASEQVLRESINTPLPVKNIFVFECNFRRNMPEMDFPQETKRIFEQADDLQPTANISGIVCIGHIAPIENRKLGRYYKTVLIASAYE